MLRVTALCAAAGRVRDRQREDFEARLRDHLNERQAHCDGYFKAIHDAAGRERTADAISALSGLVGSAGQKLRLANFEEFDDSMTNSDAPLVL